MRSWFADLPADTGHWLQLLISAGVAVLAAAAAHWLVFRIIARATHKRPFSTIWIDLMRRPALCVLVLLALQPAVNGADDSLPGIPLLRYGLALALAAAATWMAIRWVDALRRVVVARHPLSGDDGLHARDLQTKATVLARTAVTVIVIVGIAAGLMAIPGVRQIGAGILASAGLAGIAIGLAAKPILGNLLSGLQVAFTQPIRLGDEVIVQNEFGIIEELNSTYVVVKVWDERRIVAPLQWFIENPFQNWTRSSQQLLGAVYLWVDYRMPVEPLRAELRRICETEPNWDKRVAGVQVTDFTEQTMQIRFLVSAADSGRTFDLRCAVRERIIDFVKRDYAEYLPTVRAVQRNAPDQTPMPQNGRLNTAVLS